jgi:hypothetical protein
VQVFLKEIGLDKARAQANIDAQNRAANWKIILDRRLVFSG